MAFTKIVSPGIDTTGSYTVQELNTVGVVTAGTVQVGSATTIHTTGIDLGSGNITSHNINSTGIITATSFVGPVTGNITGDITATSGTFSGNVSIGGTLTYEDVTNIDSVGVVTARSGINVTGGVVSIDSADGYALEVKNGNTQLIGLYKEDASGGYIYVRNAAGTSNISLNGNDGDATFKGDLTIADKIIHDSDTDTAIRFPANDAVTVETAGSERLRIDSSGRVLIGETSAILETDNALLQIGAEQGANMVLYRDDSSVGVDDSLGLIRFYSNAGSSKQEHARITATAGAASGDGDKPGNLIFYTTADGASSPTERLRITSAGSVGIGTNVPQATLHLLSSGGAATGNEGIRLQTTQATGGNWISFNDTARKGYFGYKETSDDGIYLVNEKNSHIVLGTNGAERLRITSNGQVLVGNYATHSSIHGNLEVNGNDGINISNATRSGSNGAQWRLIPHNGGGSATNLRLFEGAGGTEVINITKTGRIGVNRLTPSFMLDIIGNSSTGANCIRIVDGAETGHGSHPAKIVAGGTYYQEMQMHSRRFVVHTYNGSSIAERFRVHHDGNVSITENPTTNASKLFIRANSGANAGKWSDSCIALYNTTGASEYSQMGLGYTLGTWAPSYMGYINTATSSYGMGALVFGTRNVVTDSQPTERLRIKSDGEIKIPGSGMITINEGSPSGNFYQEISYAPGGKGCLYLENFAYYGSQPALVVNDQDTNNQRVMEDVQFQRNGTLRGYIRINPGSVTYSTSSSDIRTKKNFEDWTEDNLSKFKTLSPKLFNWIEEDDGSEKTKGFIAQDNLEKFPEAYPLTASTDRYAFNPSGMVAYLMKALQEAALKIETLEGRIDDAGL